MPSNNNLPATVLLVTGDGCTEYEVREALPTDSVLHTVQTTEVAMQHLHRAKDVEIVLLDASVSTGKCIEFINDVYAFYRHIQCVMVCTDRDIARLIEVKNAVIVMAAYQLPWQKEPLGSLIERLADRARELKDQFTLLEERLIDQQRMVRATRMSMCFQALSGVGNPDQLAPLYLAAVKVRESDPGADFNKFDVWEIGAREAKRMVLVLKHVSRWIDQFNNGLRLNGLADTFSQQEGQIVIHEIDSQLKVFNGGTDETPEAKDCCLLAYLVWNNTPMSVEQRDKGVWVLTEARGLHQLNNWLKDVMRTASIC